MNLRGYDETYTLDEWFDDFRIEYKLVDTPEIRAKILMHLSPKSSWEPRDIYQANKKATEQPKSFISKLLGL